VVLDGRRIRMTAAADPSDSTGDSSSSRSSQGDIFDLERWPANWLQATNCPAKGVSVVIKSVPHASLQQLVALWQSAAGVAGNPAELMAAAQRLWEYASQQADLNIHLQVSTTACCNCNHTAGLHSATVHAFCCAHHAATTSAQMYGMSCGCEPHHCFMQQPC
jgi:hypothetical protein